MVYLVGWAAIYCAILLQAVTRYRGHVFLVVVLIYFTSVAFFRGGAGTDTGTYESIITKLDANYTWTGIEPGFIAIGWILKELLGNTELAVRSMALVFFGLIAIFVARSTREERFMLLAYFLPAFAYSYSMNVLRTGLAAAVILLVAQNLIRNGNLKSLRWVLMALLFHYSSIFSMFYMFVSQRSWLRFYSTLVMLLLMSLLVASLSLADTYFIAKTAVYEEYKAPGPLSGLGLIIPVFIILTGMLFGVLPLAEKLKLFALGAGFLILAWGFTQVSYAGLRVLDLVAFNVPLSIMVTYSRLKHQLDNWFKLSTAIGGFLIAAAFYKGFVESYGQDRFSFLPYDTWL